MLPLLVPLMLGMIQYGHYFWITMNAIEAAKVGLAGAVAQQTTTSASNCTDTLVTDPAHIVEAAGVTAATSVLHHQRALAGVLRDGRRSLASTRR